MASMKHDGLVSLFRNHPALAPELLQGPLGMTLPAWSEARVESLELTEVLPTGHPADFVVLLRKGKPVFAIVVEVQVSRSARKRKSWPVYLTSLRAQMECATVLLVVAPDKGVARWCARPISLGHPGFVLQPLVVGPGSIPMGAGKQQAGQSPELASARRALELMMRSGHSEYQSEFVRKFVAHGLERGREAGHLEGERQALIKVLEARGLIVEGVARRSILACMEVAQLERWLGQAVTVQSVRELFKAKPSSRPAARSAGSHPKARKPRAKR